MKKYMLMLAVPALLVACGDPKVETPYDAGGQWDAIASGPFAEDGSKDTINYTQVLGKPLNIVMTDKATGDFRIDLNVENDAPEGFEVGRGNTKRGEVRIYFADDGESAAFFECEGAFDAVGNTYAGDCKATQNNEVILGTEEAPIKLQMTRR